MGVRQLVEYLTQSQTGTFELSRVNVAGLAPTASFGTLHGTFALSTVNVSGLTPSTTLAPLTRTFGLSQVNVSGLAATATRTNTFELSTVHVTALTPQATYTVPVWLFEPPVVFDVPRVLPDTTGPSGMLFRRYANLARGRTVLKIGGAYVTTDTPSAEQVEQAEITYVGGHVYEVDSAEAAALTAAGYTVSLSPVLGVPQTPTPPAMPTPVNQTGTFALSTVQAVPLAPVVVSHTNRNFELSQVRVSGLAPTGRQVTARKFELSRVNVSGLTPTGTNVAVGPLADDFNGTTLDTSLWTFEDPVGGSSVAVSGGLLRLSVAGTVDHDSYSALLSPRVYQRINNANFYVEAKMTSSVLAEQDSMGFLVTSSDEHKWVRAIFYRDGAGLTRVYAAYSLDNGTTVTGVFSTSLGAQTAPLWLRLYYVSATNSYTVEYSTTGSAWTNAGSFVAAIVPARMMLAAGNSGPGFGAWTATFDHLHLATGTPVAPPSIAGARYFGAFRFGASQSNLQPIETFMNRQLEIELVHGPRGSWSAITAVGQSGIGDFPGRRISYTADIIPPGYSFVDAANGLADSFWRDQVNQIVNTYNHPDAILRPWHEFNLSYSGEWYTGAGAPWTPAQGVAMYRRYVQVARSVPNQHLRFDWCYLFGDGVNVFTGGYYPGDDVVDIIGCDLYNRNWSTNLTTRWNTILTHYNGLNNLASFAAAHGKLISFPETMNANYTSDTTASSGDDTTFITNLAAWIAAHTVEYFDWYADGGHGIETDWYDDSGFANTKSLLHTLYAH